MAGGEIPSFDHTSDRRDVYDAHLAASEVCRSMAALTAPAGSGTGRVRDVQLTPVRATVKSAAPLRRRDERVTEDGVQARGPADPHRQHRRRRASCDGDGEC